MDDDLEWRFQVAFRDDDKVVSWSEVEVQAPTYTKGRLLAIQIVLAHHGHGHVIETVMSREPVA